MSDEQRERLESLLRVLHDEAEELLVRHEIWSNYGWQDEDTPSEEDEYVERYHKEYNTYRVPYSGPFKVQKDDPQSSLKACLDELSQLAEVCSSIGRIEITAYIRWQQ